MFFAGPCCLPFPVPVLHCPAWACFHLGALQLHLFDLIVLGRSVERWSHLPALSGRVSAQAAPHHHISAQAAPRRRVSAQAAELLFLDKYIDINFCILIQS